MSDFAELAKRVERLRLPKGERDSDLEYKFEWALSDYDNLGGGFRRHKQSGIQERYHGHDFRYFESLDAALELCARVLPRWKWSLNPVNAFLIRPDGDRRKILSVTGTAATPALCLCAAILKAKLKEEEERISPDFGRHYRAQLGAGTIGKSPLSVKGT